MDYAVILPAFNRKEQERIMPPGHYDGQSDEAVEIDWLRRMWSVAIDHNHGCIKEIKDECENRIYIAQQFQKRAEEQAQWRLDDLAKVCRGRWLRFGRWIGIAH